MRLRSIGACLLTALTLVAVPACGSDGDDSADTSPSENSTTTAASDEEADAQAGITLEDPGGEPRQPLRLRIAAGTTTRTALVNKLTLNLTAGGETLSDGAAPTTRLVLEQKVDRVDPDGTLHYQVTFTEASALDTPGVGASVVRETQEGLDQLEGLRGTGTIDARGGSQEADFDTSSITDETMKSLLESTASQIGNLSAPFPRSPVGPGAMWTTTNSATISGITMNTTTQYTLRSRDGDRYELDVRQQAEAPPGPTDLPNLPSSTEAVIERFTIESEGTISGDLTRLLPQQSRMTGEGGGEFTITADGETGSVTQEMTIEMTLSPA